MNSLKLFILILSASFVIACDKNDDITPNPPASSIPKIKEVYETPDSTLTTYTYDAQGRVTKENYSDGGYTDYTYIDGYAMETSYDAQGVLKASYNYELDNNGRCTSFTDSRYGYDFSFEYNAEGSINHVMAKLLDGSLHDESFLFYESGNLVKDSTYYTSGSWTVVTYEYYTDVKSTIGDKNFGILFWGEDNKNPSKKRTTILSNGYNQYVNYGIPIVNEDGFISQKLTSYGNGAYYKQEFTYYN